MRVRRAHTIFAVASSPLRTIGMKSETQPSIAKPVSWMSAWSTATSSAGGDTFLPRHEPVSSGFARKP